jgi:alpha-mannosidase
MTRRIIHLIAHTHWDREWYLPLGGFRARFIAACDDLLMQLGSEPALASFLLDGQTVLAEDYLALRPEQRGQLIALTQAGRLQLGPWYVLADEQIPSGESMLRNLTLGQRDAAELGGRLDVLYSPDAFGHPAIWPALGAEFGIGAGVVWRGLGREAGGDHDLLWWEAPDGRRLLIYHLPPDGYEIGSALLVDDGRLAAAWEGVASQLLPRAATRHVAVFVGADHHAPAPDLGALAARLSRAVPECEFRSARLDEFLQGAHSELPPLTVLRGELRASYGYTWTLQGVHGTRAHLKRRNSLLELGLVRLAEPLASLAGLGAPARARSLAPVLSGAWRSLLQCHFHDAIGGCAADPVARAMGVRFDDVSAATTEVTRQALAALTGHDADAGRDSPSQAPRLVLWNPVARPRGGVVTADLTFFRRDVLVGPPGNRRPRSGPGVAPFMLRLDGADGRPIDVAPQVLGAEIGLERIDAPRHYPDQDEVDIVRVAFPLAEALPGLGLRLAETVAGDAAPMEPFASAHGRSLWNGRVEAAIEATGTIALRAAGEGARFTGLFALESEADVGDTYSFAPVPRAERCSPGASIRPVLTAEGPFVAGLSWPLAMRCGRGERSGEGRVRARVTVEAIGDSPVLRCSIELDNQARDHRLRLRFPTGIRRAPVLAGAQFGAIERPPYRRPARRIAMETPVATAPAHRWVAVARGNRGLANFAPGFFEYEWSASGELWVTLLRAVGQLSRSDLATRPGHAGWPTATPAAQCLGTERITLGLAPIGADEIAEPERLERLWEDTFLPPVAQWLRQFCQAGPDAIRETGLALEGEGLVFSACTTTADGRALLARCYNLRDEPVRGRWRSARQLRDATLVRADETRLAVLAIDDGTSVPFDVPARGLASVLLYFTS